MEEQNSAAKPEEQEDDVQAHIRARRMVEDDAGSPDEQGLNRRTSGDGEDDGQSLVRF